MVRKRKLSVGADDEGRIPRRLKKAEGEAGRICAIIAKEPIIPKEQSRSFYEYRPLEGKQTIRLLRPLSGSALAYELLHIDLHKAPPYLALSYTWGSNFTDDAITVDGHSITIPRNLADAMKPIGDYVKERRLMLWADSVCINQDDVRERGHQVGFMHAIYRCAEYVGIWLGKSAAESDLVMDKMSEWKREYDRLCEPFGANWELGVANISSSNSAFYGQRHLDNTKRGGPFRS